MSPVIEVTADAAGSPSETTAPACRNPRSRPPARLLSPRLEPGSLRRPDRGRQGNALKTLLPMPRVIDPDGGRFIVTAHGKRHVITCGADPISQRAVIKDDVTEPPKSKNRRPGRGPNTLAFLGGTEVRIEWTPKGDGDRITWPFAGLEPLDDGDY